MVFSPPRSPGIAIGLAAVGILLAINAGLISAAWASPLSAWSFLAGAVLLASLPVLFEIGYRTWALARARYVLSRNALVVEWGGRRLLMPMPQLIEGRAGSEFEASLKPRGPTWPGNIVGRAAVETLGEVEFLAASPQAGMVLLRYPDGWLAISPADPQAFLSALARAQAEGPEQEVEAESLYPAFTQWDLWQDRLALGLMAVGAAGALLLLGYLALISPQLPAEIALHFDAQGRPDRFGPPAGLLILPLIAGLAWLVNTSFGLWAYRNPRERTATYLLLGATVFVQALVWIATITLLMAGNPA
jgi:hypothetical protein